MLGDDDDTADIDGSARRPRRKTRDRFTRGMSTPGTGALARESEASDSSMLSATTEKETQIESTNKTHST